LEPRGALFQREARAAASRWYLAGHWAILLTPAPFCASYLHHPGALWYSSTMSTRRKAAAAKSVRQSVTMPAALASEVKRVAKERHVTISRALVTLAERGVRAEAEAKEQLKASYRRFIDEKEPALKNEAGLELIRSIFGTDSIAEDSVR